jgi:hypothetical protein
MKKNRKLRRADSPFNFILTFGTLLLGILFVWIMKLEMDTQIETGLKTYLQQQQQAVCNIVLQTEAEPEDTYPDRLIANIEEGFETSASQFVYIEKAGQLLFVKNTAEMNAVEVQQLDLTSYMKRMEKSRGAYRTSVFQTENGYTVGVCVREDYVKTIMGYDVYAYSDVRYHCSGVLCHDRLLPAVCSDKRQKKNQQADRRAAAKTASSGTGSGKEQACGKTGRRSKNASGAADREGSAGSGKHSEKPI